MANHFSTPGREGHKKSQSPTRARLNRLRKGKQQTIHRRATTAGAGTISAIGQTVNTHTGSAGAPRSYRRKWSARWCRSNPRPAAPPRRRTSPRTEPPTSPWATAYHEDIGKSTAALQCNARAWRRTGTILNSLSFGGVSSRANQCGGVYGEPAVDGLRRDGAADHWCGYGGSPTAALSTARPTW
jgi:hypothetical protein